MLYPQQNRYRTIHNLSGFWEVKIDKSDDGEQEGWASGFKADTLVGVPGSWNEQLAELGYMNYVGTVWYQTRFALPDLGDQSRLLLRFGSVDHHAKVWINGKISGEHQGGYLPFEFDITDLINDDSECLLVIRVNNTLNHDTIPQGVSEEDHAEFQRELNQNYPPVNFDFFPYGGIHRPVVLSVCPRQSIRSIQIDTSIDGKSGQIHLQAKVTDEAAGSSVRVTLSDSQHEVAQIIGTSSKGEFTGDMVIRDCQFWSPEAPFLYQLRFELLEGDDPVDEYRIDVGVRQIEVKGTKLMLNGQEIFLRGFGRHEDFPVLGKGFSHALVVKDFQLMKWIGANSFRTSHYPYAEEVMQLADRFGFLVIDEVPAVSLNFRYVTDKTHENHKRMIADLIARDRNHPSVICWSVGNESGIWGEQEATSERARQYWSDIFAHTRDLDRSRACTMPACYQMRDEDPSFHHADFISVNRYWGWYGIPGDLDKAGEQLKNELEHLHKKFKKPIMVTEFGADTIPGEHATFPQMFTEEYQGLLIKKYFDIIESLPFTIGEHIWNFADFRTAQHHRRVVLNRKGVFTRERDPKCAAFIIRKHWLPSQDA